jgi:hypothetical protein
VFYVYFWLRDDGTPYYVGKGIKNRAFKQSGHRVQKPHSSYILIQEYDSEEDAFTAEKFFIAFYGRFDIHTGCLANLTDGGEGPAGFVPSDELKNLWSKQRKGNQYCLGHKHSEQTKEKMSQRTGVKNPFFGKTHSNAARQAIAESNKRRLWTLESTRKMAEGVATAFTTTRKKAQSALALSMVRDSGGRFVTAR